MRGYYESLATVSRLLCDPLATFVTKCRKPVAVQWDRGFRKSFNYFLHLHTCVLKSHWSCLCTYQNIWIFYVEGNFMGQLYQHALKFGPDGLASKLLRFTVNSKWIWSGNTTITNCRQTHGTARKRHTTISRHQEDKLSKATSSLFPILIIAKLELT